MSDPTFPRIECQAGWQKLYQPLLDLCALYGVQVMQVKEKFGGLRFYVQGTRAKELDAIISAAEAQSLRTCENCGEDGNTIVTTNTTSTKGFELQPKVTTGPSETSRWLRTLCAPCRKAWDESRAPKAPPATNAPNA